MTTENNLLKSQMRIYFRKINKLLVCDRKTKSKVLKDFKNNVYDYIDNNPNTSFDELVEHFGTPDTIAEEFAAEMGADYIRKTKCNKKIKIIFIVILASIAVFIGILTTVIILNNSRNAVYYYEETVSDFGIVE